MQIRSLGVAIILGILAISGPLMARDAGALDNDRLDKVIHGLDGVSGHIESESGFWLFEFRGRTVYVVVNPANYQLQILAPIVQADTLNQPTLVRALQANFSATNEARYAIAKGLLWSVYASSLANLTETEFIISLKQVVSSATTFANLIVLEEAKPDANDDDKSDGFRLITPEDKALPDGRS